MKNLLHCAIPSCMKDEKTQGKVKRDDARNEITMLGILRSLTVVLHLGEMLLGLFATRSWISTVDIIKSNIGC